jgi:hypothetical protein
MLPARRDREVVEAELVVVAADADRARGGDRAQPTPRSVTRRSRRPFRRIVIAIEPSALSRIAAETCFQRPKWIG